jgi:hypothetical protein
MSQYRKKPVVIDAVQWDGDASTANLFIGERFGVDWWYFREPTTGKITQLSAERVASTSR